MKKYTVPLLVFAVLGLGISDYLQSDTVRMQSERIDLLQERLKRLQAPLNAQQTCYKGIEALLERQTHLNTITLERMQTLERQCHE